MALPCSALRPELCLWRLGGARCGTQSRLPGPFSGNLDLGAQCGPHRQASPMGPPVLRPFPAPSSHTGCCCPASSVLEPPEKVGGRSGPQAPGQETWWPSGPGRGGERTHPTLGLSDSPAGAALPPFLPHTSPLPAPTVPGPAAGGRGSKRGAAEAGRGQVGGRHRPWPEPWASQLQSACPEPRPGHREGGPDRLRAPGGLAG